MSTACYVTFPTTYNALRAEKVLKETPYSYRMVPVPRSISSSCGTALKCSCPEIEEIKGLLIDANVEYEEIHELEEKQNNFSLKALFKKGKDKDGIE